MVAVFTHSVVQLPVDSGVVKGVVSLLPKELYSSSTLVCPALSHSLL